MSTWRDPILQHFTEPSNRLTLVADPDGLLLEEELLAAVRARGFDLLPFDDVVAFRYTYEATYRQHWDEAQSTPLVVILRSSEASLRSLPYDLLQTGRQLHFSLPELFPKLSYPVVRTIAPVHYQALYEAYQLYQRPDMGDQASQAFILKHVFGAASDMLKTPLDLLKLLLARHLSGELPPALFDDFLQAALESNPALTGSPLVGLLRDSAEFFAFLQAEWAAYITAQQAPELLTRESGGAYMPAPTAPLTHPEIRGYLHTLFVEGKLKPLALPAGWRMTEEWTTMGLITARPEVEAARRFNHLLRRLVDTVPAANSLYKEWLRLAELWAELAVLRYQYAGHLTEAVCGEYEALHLTIEARFADWLLNRYHTLHNQPFHSGPVMGHHIAGYLAAYRRQAAPKIRLALLVVDGLALDQWHIIRQVWVEQGQAWAIHAATLFAWAPTLTSIARQAIFAGQPPQLFPDSWSTTDREAKRWQQFWQEHQLPPTAVGYMRNLGAGVPGPFQAGAVANEDQATSILEPEVVNLIQDPRLQVVGLVVNTVDTISHGMQLGTAGMHQQVRLWLSQPAYLTHLVTKLLAERFTVFLTADHGNVWAQGMGRPNEGVLVEKQGYRARIYTDPAFLDLARQQLPEAMEWPNIGLPAQLRVLLAPPFKAFADAHEQVVCHGGIAVEEVIVPFVRITPPEVE